MLPKSRKQFFFSYKGILTKLMETLHLLRTFFSCNAGIQANVEDTLKFTYGHLIVTVGFRFVVVGRPELYCWFPVRHLFLATPVSPE